MNEDSNHADLVEDEIVSPERRKALGAIKKYAAYGALSSIVVLSSADAVKATATSSVEKTIDDSVPIGGTFDSNNFE